MNKMAFFLELSQRLRGIPWAELEDRWAFYSEMIDDRMEEGLTEEQAVAAIGTVEEVAAQILEEVPLAALIREQVKTRRRMSALEIVLLVLGSPIWFSLAMAVFAVVISIYAAVWSAVISLWAVVVSVWACAVGFLAGGIVLLCVGKCAPGLFLVGCALICAGLAIIFVFCVKEISRGAWWLTRQPAVWLRRRLSRKECV